MTLVSFVVPTKNAERTIGACLRSLQGQHTRAGDGTRGAVDTQIGVVDNFSDDRTADIAQAKADILALAGPERCSQRNLGAELAAGEILVFIDADMVLEPTIAIEVADAIVEQELDYLVLPELAFGESYFARCRALEKELYLGDPTVEAGRAIRRSLFEQVGGWDESLTAGEDWELSDRLVAAGARLGRVEGRVWHDEGVVRLSTQFRKKRYYGGWVADFVRRGGGDHLARTALFSQPKRLAAEPALTAGLFTLKGVEAAGLATGMAGTWLRRRVGR
jgi:glycosyltransferase involved in cell wall biosynthesis